MSGSELLSRSNITLEQQPRQGSKTSKPSTERQMSGAIQEVDSMLEVSHNDSLYGGATQKDTSGDQTDHAVPQMLFSNQEDSAYRQSCFNYHA